MIVYRLTVPIERLRRLRARHRLDPRRLAAGRRLDTHSRPGPTGRRARQGRRDAPPAVRRRSHRPNPALIVKQDNNGDTFVISVNPFSWAEAGCARVEDVRPRHIGAFTHPNAEEIREAMSDLLPPRLYHSEWDNNAL